MLCLKDPAPPEPRRRGLSCMAGMAGPCVETEGLRRSQKCFLILLISCHIVDELFLLTEWQVSKPEVLQVAGAVGAPNGVPISSPCGRIGSAPTPGSFQQYSSIFENSAVEKNRIPNT